MNAIDVINMTELKEYLNRIMELERMKFELNTYLDKLKQSLYAAKHPDLHQPENGFPILDLTYNVLKVIGYLVGSFGGAYLCTLILHVILEMKFNYDLEDLHDILIGTVFYIAFLKYFIYKFQNPFLIFINQKKVKTRNQEAIINNERILVEANQKSIIIQDEISRAEASVDEIQEMLDGYYSADVVYKKYRSLVPITMFYEYFDSGRCCNFQGIDGAYNIYENDIRMDNIISRLDDIISDLDSIRNHQCVLSDLIDKANQNIVELETAANQ